MMDFDQDKIFKNLHVDIISEIAEKTKKNLKQLVFFLNDRLSSKRQNVY